MSRINLPRHPMRPESPLLYNGKSVAKLTRREALELIDLIASEQIEEVQSLGLDWHNPYRISIPMSVWRDYLNRPNPIGKMSSAEFEKWWNDRVSELWT